MWRFKLDFDFYEKMDMPDSNLPVKVLDFKFDIKGNIIMPHWHEHGEFLFFYEGNAVVICGNQTYYVNPMNLIYVNSCELHSIKNESGKLGYIVVICDLNKLIEKPVVESENIISSLINSNRIIFENLMEDNKEIIQIIDSVKQFYESKQIGYELKIRSLMLNCFFIMVNKHIQSILTENESINRKSKFKKLEKLFQYIEVSYNNPISTADCAKMLNFSLAHFCHTFKNATGKSFLQYLNEYRIFKSMTLLKETDLSIVQIASECGFEDSGYYTRCFKKITGISPSLVRRTQGDGSSVSF